MASDIQVQLEISLSELESIIMDGHNLLEKEGH
jgi:hypothetical protein